MAAVLCCSYLSVAPFEIKPQNHKMLLQLPDYFLMSMTMK